MVTAKTKMATYYFIDIHLCSAVFIRLCEKGNVIESADLIRKVAQAVSPLNLQAAKATSFFNNGVP